MIQPGSDSHEYHYRVMLWLGSAVPIITIEVFKPAVRPLSLLISGTQSQTLIGEFRLTYEHWNARMHKNSSGTARVTAPLFALVGFKYNSVYHQHLAIQNTPYIQPYIPRLKTLGYNTEKR